MNVKTFVVKVEDYETALEKLDSMANNFFESFVDRRLNIDNDSVDVQDALYPPVSNGDFPRLARRVVYKMVWRQ